MRSITMLLITCLLWRYFTLREAKGCETDQNHVDHNGVLVCDSRSSHRRVGTLRITSINKLQRLCT